MTTDRCVCGGEYFTCGNCGFADCDECANGCMCAGEDEAFEIENLPEEAFIVEM